MQGLLILLARLAGMLDTAQSGANASLNKGLGQPVLTALCVTLGNVAVSLLAGAFMGTRWPWCFSRKKLGAAVFTGCTVTAAVITSVPLDHFGLVGFKEYAAGLWRILGCGLTVVRLVLISVS